MKSPTYLADAEKAQAHKRQVLGILKTVLYAPVAIGKSAITVMGGGSLVGNNKIKPTEDDNAILSPISSTSPFASMIDDSATYYLDNDAMGNFVSLELSLHLIHANKESLGRALVISSALDPTKL